MFIEYWPEDNFLDPYYYSDTCPYGYINKDNVRSSVASLMFPTKRV